MLTTVSHQSQPETKGGGFHHMIVWIVRVWRKPLSSLSSLNRFLTTRILQLVWNVKVWVRPLGKCTHCTYFDLIYLEQGAIQGLCGLFPHFLTSFASWETKPWQLLHGRLFFLLVTPGQIPDNVVASWLSHSLGEQCRWWLCLVFLNNNCQKVIVDQRSPWWKSTLSLRQLNFHTQKIAGNPISK